MHHRIARWIVVGAIALAPSVARAQSGAAGDAASAEALFEAGRRAMEQRDFPSACAKFRESERLDPAPGTLLNLADCEERLGHLASAWEAWKEAVATLPRDDARLPMARARERAIDARVPRLTLTLAPGAPAGTMVRKDDVEMRDASFGVPLPIDPGAHTIVIIAPDHDPVTTQITIAEGESKTIAVEPGPQTQTQTQTPTRPPTPTQTQTQTPTPPLLRPLGFLSLGVGAAGLALGSIFGLEAISQKSTVDSACFGAKGCTQAGADASRAGRTDAIVSDVGFIAGAALVATGVVLVLASPSPSSRTGVVASPTILAGGGGVSVGGRF